MSTTKDADTAEHVRRKPRKEIAMTYRNKFGQYAVMIGFNTYKWFKLEEKARECYEELAQYPDELEDTLKLVVIKTGEVLAETEPEDE